MASQKSHFSWLFSLVLCFQAWCMFVLNLRHLKPYTTGNSNTNANRLTSGNVTYIEILIVLIDKNIRIQQYKTSNIIL